MTKPTEHHHASGRRPGPSIEELARIFAQVVEQPRDRQAAMLEQLCPDHSVRQQVRDLLDADVSADLLLDHSLLPKPLDVHVGERIANYKLLQELGQGGMGVVFMAEQREPVRRTVALKVVKPGVDTREVIARFDAERQALSMMDHPNIAKVLDAGTTDSGRPFFVMELVKGQPITTYCDDNRLSVTRRLQLFLSVCHAIQHAHQKGIIHRDIKPSNVLVAEYDGRPVAKVIDFGVAKAINQSLTEMTMFTGFGQIIGTFEYMSPEQSRVNQLDVDTRSDIYSLGVLLYELLTGKPPFDTERLRSATWEEMLKIIREEDPPKPSSRLSEHARSRANGKQEQSEPAKLFRMVRGELDWVVMKAMEKDRNRRYETPNELAHDIESFLNGDAVAACPPSPMYRIRKFARRNKVAFATTSIVAISLVLGLIGTTGQAIRASRAEEAAANSAAEAEAFNDFLVEDLLGLAGAESQLSAGLQPDPNLKLETLLNRASEKVDQSFADRPELKAKLKGTLAKSFRSIGQYDVAIEICEELLAYSIANKGKKHSDTIRIMRQLARVYIDQSQLADAESLCQEALEYSREVLGPEDPETLLLMNVLAILYYEQERYAASERVHRECLEIRRRQLGERNPDTLATMSNLALVYESLDRFEAAGELHSQVLERHRQIFDARHPRVAASLHNLGRYYLQRGRLTDNPTLFETAESPLFEALGIYRQVRGENHPDSLGVQRDLVDVFCEQHRYGEAESMLLDFVDRVRSVLGSEHDVTLQALNTLGWIYLRQERYAEAEYILDDVLTTRRAKSLEDPATIQTMGNLAIVYRVMGKRRDSILLDEELRELADEVLGSEHPQTLSSMVRLGLSYLDDGQRREGKNLLEEAFESGQELSGVFNIAGVVATSYAEEGDSQQALTWTNHQVESAGRELPGDGLRMAQVLGDGGQRLLKIEAWTDAERLLSRSLSIRESLEPDAWATHETRSKLGVALAGQARYGDAESLLKESYAELLKQVSDHPDGSHGKLIIVLDRLIAFYDDVENEPEAAKLRKERAEIEAASIAR